MNLTTASENLGKIHSYVCFCFLMDSWVFHKAWKNIHKPVFQLGKGSKASFFFFFTGTQTIIHFLTTTYFGFLSRLVCIVWEYSIIIMEDANKSSLSKDHKLYFLLYVHWGLFLTGSLNGPCWPSFSSSMVTIYFFLVHTNFCQ